MSAITKLSSILLAPTMDGFLHVKVEARIQTKPDSGGPDFLESPRTSFYRDPHDFQQIPENSAIGLELTKNFMLYLYDQSASFTQKFKDEGQHFTLIDLYSFHVLAQLKTKV